MTVPEGQQAWRPGARPEQRDAAGKLVTRLSIFATAVATLLFGMHWGFRHLGDVFTAKALSGTSNDHRTYFEQIYQATLWGIQCSLAGSLAAAFAVGLAVDGVRRASPASQFVARCALIAAIVVALGYIAVCGFQIATEMITE
ncbi:hypothetical protein BKG76_00355 [Mycobacteroides franklinii]|uniref:Uncharacterized protein n=1 Tax=Mycobacteroides franklinii TaxID=948102 RepID=A0A1S1LHU1_9MYCO|nr:hypothetical protein [Mycobacteroides franklinii]OHU31700.1 hypothetical protein BKG76_00355 [Mycobacteroides franklinii]